MKRKVAAYIAVAGLASVILADFSWAGLNQKPDFQTQSKGKWNSAPALSNKLGSEMRIDDYACRLPQGYLSFPTPAELMSRKPFSDGEIQAYQYRSRNYSDGIASVISYHIFSAGYIAYINNFPVSPSDTKSLTESWLYAQRVVTLRHHPAAVFSREEYGQLGTLHFIRQYVQYPELQGGKKFVVHSFTYVSISASGGIETSFFDSEPHSKVSLPIAEASVLTLHEAPANADTK